MLIFVLICVGISLGKSLVQIIEVRKEIQFAIQKPHMVKSWRENYEANVVELEKNLGSNEDPNKELIEEILEQFRGGKM